MQTITSTRQEPGIRAPMLAYNIFLSQVGVDRSTGWRWRRDGLIQTVNLYGRLYVSADEMERFKQRAIAGEFSRVHKTPKRTQTGTTELPEKGAQ